jgi:hypothetical protein
LKRKTIFKIVIWFLAILILLAGILYSVGYFYSSKIMKSYLTEAVKKESKGLYKLEIGSLTFNVLSGNLTIKKFSLVPDTAFYRIHSCKDTMAPLLVKIKLEKINIKGFRVLEALIHRRIDLSRILFSGTEVTVYRMKIPPKQSEEKHKEKILSIPLPKGLHSIEIGEFITENAKLDFIDCSCDSIIVNSFPTCDIFIKHILVDSTHKGKTRLFNADDIRITLGTFSLPMRNGMNKLSFGEIGFSTASSELYINDFHLEPLYSKFDYTRKLGFQTDWADVRVSRLILRRINLPSLLSEGKITVGLVEIDSAFLNDYRDKRVALKPGYTPPMPQELLRKLTTYLRIDTVLLKSGRINYEEQTGKVPGKLFFDKVNVTFTGLTNDSMLLKAGLVSELKGTLYLMGTGKIDAMLRLHLSDLRNAFYFSAQMGPFDLVEVNPMVSNLLGVKVVSGKVKKVIIPLVKADDDFATGTMQLYYNDLAIDILDKEQTTWAKIKTGVMGWVVNDLIVSNDNPAKSGEMKTGAIHASRKKELGFPNYLWRSVFSGLKSTVGINSEEQKGSIKKEEKKKE